VGTVILSVKPHTDAGAEEEEEVNVVSVLVLITPPARSSATGRPRMPKCSGWRQRTSEALRLAINTSPPSSVTRGLRSSTVGLNPGLVSYCNHLVIMDASVGLPLGV